MQSEMFTSESSDLTFKQRYKTKSNTNRDMAFSSKYEMTIFKIQVV